MATMEAVGTEPKVEAPEKVSADIRIDLDTPVQAYGEFVKKLVFRKPTGGDIMALGDTYPINIDWQTGKVTPHPVAMGNIMSVLAQVPLSTIKMMEARDWATCAHRLQGFFVPGEQAMQS